MRLDPVGSQAGAVEEPVRPDAGSDHSRVVDWFALTDSNLPEPEAAAAPPALPRPVTAEVAVGPAPGPLSRSWRQWRTATRRAWHRILGRRERTARKAEPDSTPAAGGPQ